MDSDNFYDNIIKSWKHCFKICCWRTNDNYYDYMELGVDDSDDISLIEKKNNELRDPMNKNVHQINGEKVTFHDDN